MLITEVYALYGSWSELSRKLSFGSTTYQGWIRRGYIPFRTQETIEFRTKGLVKASMEHTKPQKDADKFKRKPALAN